ncbi:MAG: alkyl hydroperoxide reductase [Planctomycetaceae bacterium]|nr:alkyl hydroperoxide reductase [Planctomycetaceae bacterium]
MNSRGWQRTTLVLAGLYNLAWGALVVFAPRATLEWLGLAVTTTLEEQLWGCIGMFVLVWGIGYLAAARDPLRHWPIVLVGLLGKVFGPIGFALALSQDLLPLSMGKTLLTNDLVWWIPFGWILFDARRAARERQS